MTDDIEVRRHEKTRYRVRGYMPGWGANTTDHDPDARGRAAIVFRQVQNQTKLTLKWEYWTDDYFACWNLVLLSDKTAALKLAKLFKEAGCIRVTFATVTTTTLSEDL